MHLSCSLFLSATLHAVPGPALAVACPASPSDPDAYDWSAYAAAYAAAPTDFPDSFLNPPPLDSCAAGCLPQAIDNATSIQRIGKSIF